MDSHCDFCKITSGDIAHYPIAWNNDFIAFLEIRPFTEGHVIAMPRKHFKTVIDIPNGMATAFSTFYINVGRRLVTLKKNATGRVCSLQAIMFSDKIPHAHVHLIPVPESTEKIFRNNYMEVLRDVNRKPEDYQRLTFLCNRYKIGNI